jgi:geranylgeranyl diphosphate synthase type II
MPFFIDYGVNSATVAALSTQNVGQTYRRFLQFCESILGNISAGRNLPSSGHVLNYVLLRDFGCIRDYPDPTIVKYLEQVRSSETPTRMRAARVVEVAITQLLIHGRLSRVEGLVRQWDRSEHSEYLLLEPYLQAVFRRIQIFNNLLRDFPRQALQDEALFKLVRMVVGVVFVYEYFLRERRAETLSPQYVVDLGLCYGIGFSLIDNIVDNSHQFSQKDKHYLSKALSAVFAGTAGRSDIPLPLPAMRDSRELIDSLSTFDSYNRSRPLLIDFVESQFNPNINPRISGEPSCSRGRLLAAGCRQAVLSRVSLYACLGVQFSKSDIAKLCNIAMHNQLTNDIEGISRDQRTTLTPFNCNNVSPTALSLVFATTENIIETHPKTLRPQAEEVLFLRLLESISAASRLLSRTELENRIGHWITSCSGARKYEAATVIADASRAAGRLHKEYIALKPVIRALHKTRRARLSKMSLGKRAMLDSINRHTIPLEASIEGFAKSEAAAYALRQPASRIRSHVYLEVARRLGCDAKSLMDSAVALEFSHTASLIIDDLPSHDNAFVRRERPSLHSYFGEEVAILTAIELVSASYALLNRMDRYNKFNINSIGLCDQILRGPSGMLQGQLRDLRSSDNFIPSSWSYIKNNYQKSGAPFRFALELAALVANAHSLQKALGRIGLRLGLLYQLNDDVMDREIPSIKKTWIERCSNVTIRRVSEECDRADVDPGLGRLFHDLAIYFSPPRLHSTS